MTIQEKLIARFGNPMESPKVFEVENCTIWDTALEFPWVSEDITVFGQTFRRIKCHKMIVEPLRIVFKRLYELGLHEEIKTFDGCFQPRYIRGQEKKGILSIHSWALAVDFNASQNPLGLNREECIARGLKPFSKEFVQVWRDAGWKCGEDFDDLMHFEWTINLF